MIRIEALTKRFGGLAAVEGVSLEIAKGEMFAFLGPNGSGKTTTLKCLVGLVRPTTGRILVGGRDLRHHEREIRRTVSYLPQRVLFQENLSAAEVLEFYRNLRRLSARRVEETFSETQFRFNGVLEKPVGTLSGGMMQRLGLVVACLPDAPVLVLDEPMVNLDPEGAVRFREFLLELKGRGKTIVFSSHMLADVEQLADRVAIMVNGRLIVVESVEALRTEVRERSRMHVRFRNPSSRWQEVVRIAGADSVVTGTEAVTITLPEQNRFEILRVLEAAGAEIASFSTEEPTLEDVYLRYIHDQRRQQLE